MRRLPRAVSLLLAVMLIASLAAGCGGTKPPEPAQQEPAGQAAPEQQTPAPNPKPYAGTTIRFLASNHPWTDTIRDLLPKFEAETGIKVNMESIAENQLNQKLTVELTSGAGTVDVFMGRPLQEAKLFGQNGWYADLKQFINDPARTSAEYDFPDFFPSAVEVFTVSDLLGGIPIITEQQVLYYRKDLFEQKGIRVPTTFAELEDAARQLHDPGNGFYGITLRGKGNPATTQLATFLFSMGGDFITGGKASLNTPEAVKAFELYGRLLREYGPPGALNMEWPQAAAIFAQGKAAMWMDANSLFLNVTAPDKSTVGDKVGFAQTPAGDKGSISYNATAWGISIAESSRNKDAAWELVKFLTSKETTLATQSRGNPSARASAWEHPDGTKAWPAEWVSAAVAAQRTAKPYDRPLVINVGKARDLVGDVITAAITGKDVKAAADISNQKLQELIDSEAK